MSEDGFAETLTVLDRLIAFDTVSENSNQALVGYVETYLRDRGFTVHLMPDRTWQKSWALRTPWT